VYDKEKENWKMLTNKEIYAMVKNLVEQTVMLNRLRWFGHEQKWKMIEFPKKYYIYEFGNIKVWR
jgi:hypothetical protein